MNRKDFFTRCLTVIGLGTLGCKIDKVSPKTNIKHREQPKSLFDKIFNGIADPNDDDITSFKGSNFLDSGYVYAPYIPLIITPVDMNSDDIPLGGKLLARYSKKIVNTDFYNTITLH